MLFINPMWDHESERIEKQKCTPIGYAIHVIADLLGFIGLLLLFGMVGLIVYRGIVGTFQIALPWLLVGPFGVGLLSSVLHNFSWWLASRKGFRYDSESCEATWIESGKKRSYKWKA